MKTGTRSHGHGLYCCWILTFTLSFMILINISESEGQPQNYFKGSSMTQLPSKALPRIGRRSGVQTFNDPSDTAGDMPGPGQERAFTTSLYENELNENSMDSYSNNEINNNNEDSPGEFNRNGHYYIGGGGEPVIRHLQLVDGDGAGSNIPHPRFRFRDHGMLYVWKSLGRRETETNPGRSGGASRIAAGGGGFRQDQPTGFIQQFRRRR